MFGHQFFFSTIRKSVILFGTLFDDIIIRRQLDGEDTALIKVPLIYAAKDKMLARVNQDVDLTKETAITLPRMSFYMGGVVYDGTRKLNTIQRVVRKDETNPNKLRYQYNPVPYNLEFTLWVYSNTTEDGTKIVEQILPFFTPEWNATVNLIPEMNITVDIPIQLDSVSMEDTSFSGGNIVDRRTVIWELKFTMKTYFYGPIKKSPIIKIANTSFYVGNPEDNDVSDVVSQIIVKPGLLANGSPTTNAAASININLIEVDDDFGYTVEASGLIISE